MSIYDAFMTFMGVFSDFIRSPHSGYFLLIPLTFGLVFILYSGIKSCFSKKE